MPALASAQALPDPVQFLVAPETPGPNAPVVIEVQGVGGFLGDADITWSLNGSVVLSGAGERQFTFTTGALGTRSTVGLTIDSDTAGLIRRTFVFSPSLVNMVWEADTTLPPLSRGKPLYSGGSPLRILAFPVVYNGSSRIAASSLSFQWSRDEEPLVSQSGLGRNTLSLVGDQLKNAERVAVDVYFGTTKVARGEVVVPVQSTAVLFYERDALRGVVTDTALPGAIALTAQEITFKAEPIYFAATARNNSLAYSWTLNGEEITGPESQVGVLTLRQTGSGAGSAEVVVAVQNQNSGQFVQAAQARVQMAFGENQNPLVDFFGGPAAALLAQAWTATQSAVYQQYNSSAPGTTFQNGRINYVPLEPLTPEQAFSARGGTPLTLGDYLNTVFRLLITLGAMFAVLMLVLGGVVYMTSSVVGKLDEAKRRMRAALWGLGLLVAAWLILYTINPQLLVFTLGSVQPTPTQSTPTNSTTGGGSGSGGSQPTRITVTPLGRGESSNVPHGSNFDTIVSNLVSQCNLSSGTLKATGGGTDANGAYTTWSCI